MMSLVVDVDGDNTVWSVTDSRALRDGSHENSLAETIRNL
jgi:hypothetical protein